VLCCACCVAWHAGTDTEATLSSEYGGTGSSSATVDAVYVALGRVLTISGRTIKDEAQVGVQDVTKEHVCCWVVCVCVCFCFNTDQQQ
jgi:hypothetical protein